jgi:hypothetical protein
VGEYPDAALAAGLKILGYRWVGVLLGGWLMGFGGAYLSLAYTHLWTNGLTAGRGWMPWRWSSLPSGVRAAPCWGPTFVRRRYGVSVPPAGNGNPFAVLFAADAALCADHCGIGVLFMERDGYNEAPAALAVNIEPSD